MKREEVMQNLSTVCRAFNGTLDQHQYLQAALQWVDEQLQKAEAADKAEPKKKD